MLWHVHQHAVASGATQVVVATDDERIYQAAQGFGAKVCMTSPNHRSGTDRVAEVAERYQLAEDTIVVNLQGDEPLLPPQLIRQVAGALNASPDATVATLCEPIIDRAEVFNPNVVKVIRDQQGFALYFSRAPIPWQRDATTSFQNDQYFRHIGIYAYRAKSLIRMTQLPPCPLEQLEALEQLRVLFHGEKICVAQAHMPAGRGVDTPDDLAMVRLFILHGGSLNYVFKL